jgi:hypothetical protein
VRSKEQHSLYRDAQNDKGKLAPRRARRTLVHRPFRMTMRQTRQILGMGQEQDL